MRPLFLRLVSSLRRKMCSITCLVVLIGGTTVSHADTVSVFAAASLKPLFDRLSDDFIEHSEHQLVYNFAGSALIARQIERGAPADVFISANVQWMEHLVSAGLTHPSEAFTLAGNRLALISSDPRDAGRDIQSLLQSLGKNDKIASGLVTAVPAGQYGKAALEHIGQWENVAEHLVQVDNVRAALTLVHLGETRLGIVYASDVGTSENIHLVALFPTESHPKIEYPVTAVGASPTDATRAFLAFLRSDIAKTRLQQFGFNPAAE